VTSGHISLRHQNGEIPSAFSLDTRTHLVWWDASVPWTVGAPNSSKHHMLKRPTRWLFTHVPICDRHRTRRKLDTLKRYHLCKTSILRSKHPLTFCEGVFLVTILCHALLATIMQRWINKLQTISVVMNLILIAATMIALPVGKHYASERNSAKYIFTQTENFTTWPTGWAFMLAWMSPIWTIGDFDSCVHMSEEGKTLPGFSKYSRC
jgi:Amino acid permease